MSSPSALNVSLTPGLTGYIGACVASGRYRSASEVVRTALRMLDKAESAATETAAQSLILHISDRLAVLDDPALILKEASFLLGSHLQAYAVGYTEVSSHGIHGGWSDKEGTTFISLNEAPPSLASDLRRGEVLRGPEFLSAVKGYPRPDGAVLLVPLMRGGLIAAVLHVARHEPQSFDDTEVNLARQVSERIWSGLTRVAAEQALATSVARFRALAEAMPQMVWIADGEGNVLYSNAQCLDFAASPIGYDWRDLVHPDDRAGSAMAWANALSKGELYERTHRLRRHDGIYRWVMSRAVPDRNGDGRIEHWFGSNTEITELMDAKAILQRSKEDMEHLVTERTKALADAAEELAAEMRRQGEIQRTVLQPQKPDLRGELASSVARDLHDILSSIGETYRMLRCRVQVSGIAEIIDQGEQATAVAGKLAGQLVGFMRREHETSLPDLLAEACDLIQSSTGRSVMCTQEIEPGVWEVLADPYQFQVALLNLAIISRDAMPDGGVLTLAAHNLIVEQITGKSEWVAVEVRDTGHGSLPLASALSTEDVSTTMPNGQGVGLRLASAHEFAKRSGGWLETDSEPGIGTTVRIILPRASSDPSVSKGMGPDLALYGDATLLLVDADQAFRHSAAAYLRNFGYTVLEAGDAETAVALVRALQKLDALIVSTNLKGTSGQALATRLRRDWPELPVQFLSGEGAEGPPGEAVLAKPLIPSTLGLAIIERLGRWSPADKVEGRLMCRMRSPALRKAYLHWIAKSRGGHLPSPEQFDADELGLAPHSFTVSVEPGDPPSFQFIAMGLALTNRLGRTLENTGFAAQPEDEQLTGSLTSAYSRAARNGGAVYQSARIELGDGAPISFERLVVPLSEDGIAVSHLVGIVLIDGPSEPEGNEYV